MEVQSYSEDDVHKSIKYSIWASTDTGNKRLDRAYRDFHTKGPIYLFFSVNGRYQYFIYNSDLSVASFVGSLKWFLP